MIKALVTNEDLIINPQLSHVVDQKLKSFLKDLIWHPDYGNVLTKCLHVMKENGEKLYYVIIWMRNAIKKGYPSKTKSGK